MESKVEVTRELEVKLSKVDNIIGELAKHGYVLAIQQNKRKVEYLPNSPLSHSPPSSLRGEKVTPRVDLRLT